MATISDINSECRALCDADTTSYPAADLLRRINHAYETVVSWILRADGTWRFDDLNYTDLPIGIGTLVEGQTSYTFSNELLEVSEVDILGTDGIYHRLSPIDPSMLDGMSAEEYFGITTSSTPKGMPSYYDKNEETIKLYPAPSSTGCTLTNGIKVVFKRTADLYTAAQVTTGTKTPGFASPFHYILAYMAAIPFCMSYKKDRVALYEKKVMDMKEELLAHYAHREQDKRKIMTNATMLFR